ncbi:MAG TPA: GNAT family N-acetyltransferase [Chitinivibrionales bacterium]|nr:GNAT family N-acetyltransferase [Chitinivibrionales bacterium]
MENKIIIQQCTPAQVSAVALLHRKCISKGFISNLGRTFLSALYNSINRSPYSKVFVAYDTEQKNPAGFISAAIDTRAMYRHIVLRRGWLFALLLLPNIFRPSVVKKILETLLYPFHAGDNRDKAVQDDSISAELLSIAVDEKYRGQGIGKRLVLKMERYFMHAGVTEYKTVTFSQDVNANAFYRFCGFTRQKTFTHHKNVMSEYVKHLSGAPQ